MKAIATLIIILISSNIFAVAQAPSLFTEFSKVVSEELLAQLDALSGELNNKKDSNVLIKIYDGNEDLAGFPKRYAARMKTHVINRGINPSRILIQHCNGEKETRVEIYIVSPNTKISGCEKSPITSDKTLLFDSYYFVFQNPDFDDCCAIPGADYAAAKASLVFFAETLKNNPDSTAYIISYNGTNRYGFNYKTIRNLDSPALGRATAKTAKETLVQNGISASRIIIINGGYKDSTRNVELWLVPQGGAIPKAKPEYFPKKKRPKKKLK